MLIKKVINLTLDGNIQQLSYQAGTSQVETATVVGTVTTSGNLSVTVTSSFVTGSPLATSVAVVGGTQQVETATAAGTVTGSGNATVIVTAAGMTNSPKTVSVAVVNGDTAATWAGKVRTALSADTDVSAFFDVSGSTTAIVLTAKAKAANDATMNISLDNGTSTGITTASTSANTTAGVASDTASVVGGKIRSALNAVTAITDVFTVGGSGATVVLTKTTPAANDNTLNIAIQNGTAAGLTEDLFSVDTTGGTASGALGTFTPFFEIINATGNDPIYIGTTDDSDTLPSALTADTSVYTIAGGASKTVGDEVIGQMIGEQYILSHWVVKGTSGNKIKVVYTKRRTAATPV